MKDALQHQAVRIKPAGQQSAEKELLAVENPGSGTAPGMLQGNDSLENNGSPGDVFVPDPLQIPGQVAAAGTYRNPQNTGALEEGYASIGLQVFRQAALSLFQAAFPPATVIYPAQDILVLARQIHRVGFFDEGLAGHQGADPSIAGLFLFAPSSPFLP